jgi:hypothetical protein
MELILLCAFLRQAGGQFPAGIFEPLPSYLSGLFSGE